MCASKNPARRAEWIVWTVVLGFGIEASQAMLNHTAMEWADVRSDVCGIALGGVVAWVISLRTANRL
jgi:hypothetical protein